jgi:hypothetical protein
MANASLVGSVAFVSAKAERSACRTRFSKRSDSSRLSGPAFMPRLRVAGRNGGAGGGAGPATVPTCSISGIVAAGGSAGGSDGADGAGMFASPAPPCRALADPGEASAPSAAAAPSTAVASASVTTAQSTWPSAPITAAPCAEMPPWLLAVPPAVAVSTTAGARSAATAASALTLLASWAAGKDVELAAAPPNRCSRA